MRKSQKIIAALMAAVMTAASSALTFANADNADSDTDITASLTTADEKSEKEYTFDEFSKLSADEVKALLDEKEKTSGVECTLWTKERLNREIGKVNDIIQNEIVNVLYEGDQFGEVLDDEKIKEEAALPEKLFDIRHKQAMTCNGNKCAQFAIIPKVKDEDEEAELLAAAMNYVQLNKHFCYFYFDYLGADTDETIGTSTSPDHDVLKGDVNCDGTVDMADAVLIMQALANPNKYGENGTADNHLTAQGKENGDFNGDGLTVGDAQSIQKQLLGFDISEGQSAADLLGLKDGKIKSAVVTGMMGTRKYTFEGEKAQAVADYLSGLHLITNFSENPDHYNGTSWTIDLEYEGGDTVTVWHMGNMFIRNPLKPWYKMIYEEAFSLDGLLYELDKKSENTDTSTPMSSVRLDDKVSVQAAEGRTADEKFAAAEMNLGIELLKKAFDPTKQKEENMLISPVSISAALTMTANGADGKTLDEMEKVLGNGLTVGQLNEYMAGYIRNLPKKDKEKVYMADSIWFKDKETFKVYDEFLEKNKEYYNAELYKAAFNNDTVADINSWVSRNTEGMIPTLLEKDSLEPTENEEMLMMLINTLYFEAEWQNQYDWAPDGKFTDLNGNKRTIKQLISQEREYFDLGDADAFKKPYAGGDYSFVGILPRDNDIVEYVKNLDAEKLLAGLSECEDPDSIDLYTMIPKFEYDYGKTLNDFLKEMGMPTAFSGGADFSKINDLSVEGADPLYISTVLHKTKIELTESGTKAAAVTAVGMAAGCEIMPEPKKEVYIYLDRPFVYMIVDKNNVPLFIGAATQLGDLQ
ncbi:MAG: hypothetical protein IKW96_07455 [Ruminococcus sp.]|uniref:serpin family protein n=1 Tax=Ruminococcus sp. TaxID=41978 RepID=UPI0025FEED27|nr:serpin family protein [Ruminococcus sp.]MBR5683101.1 hypothetical protein [Ruminococcus sp.]